MSYTLLQGDVLERLRELPDEAVHCVVTSPPYWGLRDYGTGTWDGGLPGCTHQNLHGTQGQTGDRADRTFTGAQNFARDVCRRCGAVRVDQQIGLEATPGEYVAKMVTVFRELRRVLRKDGTAWVNMGDSYVSTGGARAHGWQPETNGRGEANSYPKRDGALIMPMARNRERKDADPKRKHSAQTAIYRGATAAGALKPKDLCGIPWRLAFALQDDGWWLRQDIIWDKRAPMPESVRDRCTKSHEYIFLLSKSARYYYDQKAVAEPAIEKKSGNNKRRSGAARGCPDTGSHVCGSVPWTGKTRNKRSVWHVASQAYPEAHFAAFPEALILPCILAGCPPGGTTLDPFNGRATTGVVALRNGRNYIGIDLNPELHRHERAQPGDLLAAGAATQEHQRHAPVSCNTPRDAGMTQPFLFSSATWIEVKDGNASARDIFRRHYSRYVYRDGRNPALFVGPGEKMVLLTPCARALFVWRKFKSADGQQGINCAVFRNEGAGRASDLIRHADAEADIRWPRERHFTYVNARKVRGSRTPGRCFLKAGWKYVRGADGKPALTKARKLLIIEREAVAV